jgi:hypothetical protein
MKLYDPHGHDLPSAWLRTPELMALPPDQRAAVLRAAEVAAGRDLRFRIGVAVALVVLVALFVAAKRAQVTPAPLFPIAAAGVVIAQRVLVREAARRLAREAAGPRG